MNALKRSFAGLALGLFAATLGTLLPGPALLRAQAPATAQATASTGSPTFNPQDVIPFDAAVRTGTLPNGLRYFVRHNSLPAKRVALRLTVRTGSLYEADDQQGLAHLIEHMAFNGTEHYKPGELVSYFERFGARLGPHVNAATGFDETTYMFELPTDNADVVTHGLTALADFAGGLSLIPEEVEKEKGVVIEEWRGGLGAGSRIRDKQFPALFFQSHYADRLPIGKPEIIRAAPVERLRAFYDTWYRPERMAVIAVGDIDAQQMETAIRDMFSAVKDRAPAAPLPPSAVPLPTQLLINVTADPELTSSSIELIHKRAKEDQRLVGDYRREIVARLFEEMFNDRFSELERTPDAKFLRAGAGDGGLSPTTSLFELQARVKDGGLADGLTALAIEARRVREFGFTQSELDRAKKSLLSFYEHAYSDRDKTDSGQYTEEYIQYFLEDEPSPGIVYEYQLVQSILPGISLADITASARSRLTSGSDIVLATAPQKAGLAMPSEADLRAALGAADAVAVTAWSDTSVTRALVETIPPAAVVVSRRTIPNVDVTVVKFANGLEAWLKPTDFKNDQILFSMYAKGGTSLAGDANQFNARMATNYVGLAGYGGIKPLDLDKLLAGKIATARPSIQQSIQTIDGSAAPADLETALQLLYQEFRAPNDDPEAFALMKRQLEASLANRGQSPGQVFGETLDKVNTSDHYTSKPLTLDLVASLDRAKMLSFYHDRFSNAADFTMFMVGAFKVDDVVPLLARYVGSLPSTGTRKSNYEDLGIHFPTKIQNVKVEKGREPKSQTVISFFADPPDDPREQEKVIAANTILDTALRDELREDLSQTYTVSVNLSQGLPQRGAGHVEVSFAAAPENIQGMTDRVLKAVKKLQQEGPSADLTSRAKEQARRGYEDSLKQNSYWMGRLRTVNLLGRDPGEILTRPARIDALTPPVLQDAFKKYFPLDRYTIVTLVPEAPK
jgi:zinc protease